MLHIGSFFSKAIEAYSRQKTERAAISAAIHSVLGIEVPPSDISFKDGRILLAHIPSAARSEIYIKKAKLLAQIKNILPESTYSDMV